MTPQQTIKSLSREELESAFTQRESQLQKSMATWQEYRQALFNHMAQEHKLTLLESEMNEIECIVFRHPDHLKAVETISELTRDNAALRAACAAYREFIEVEACCEADQDTTAYAAAEFLCRVGDGKDFLQRLHKAEVERDQARAELAKLCEELSKEPI